MSYRIVLAEISYQWYWFSFREYNPNITEVGESLYLAVIRDAYAPDLGTGIIHPDKIYCCIFGTPRVTSAKKEVLYR